MFYARSTSSLFDARSEDIPLGGTLPAAAAAGAISTYSSRSLTELPLSSTWSSASEPAAVGASSKRAWSRRAEAEHLSNGWRDGRGSSRSQHARGTARQLPEVLARLQAELGGVMRGVAAVTTINLHGEALHPLVCDADVATLAALLQGTAVRSLHLQSNGLGDAAAEALAAALVTGPGGARALRLVDLSHNRVGDGGAAAIFGALLPSSARLAGGGGRAGKEAWGSNSGSAGGSGGSSASSRSGADDGTGGASVATTLRTLCLLGNEVGDVGAAALAVLLAEGCGKLRHTNLNFNSVGDRGVAALAAVMCGGDSPPVGGGPLTAAPEHRTSPIDASSAGARLGARRRQLATAAGVLMGRQRSLWGLRPLALGALSTSAAAQPLSRGGAALVNVRLDVQVPAGRLKKQGKAARKRIYKVQNECELAAALRVQLAWRRRGGAVNFAKHLFARAGTIAAEEGERRELAARRVQLAWRRRQGSFAAHMLQLARTEEMAQALRDAPFAIRIQEWWRARKGALAYARSLKERLVVAAEEEARLAVEAEARESALRLHRAARRVQRAWRRRAAAKGLGGNAAAALLSGWLVPASSASQAEQDKAAIEQVEAMRRRDKARQRCDGLGRNHSLAARRQLAALRLQAWRAAVLSCRGEFGRCSCAVRSLAPSPTKPAKRGARKMVSAVAVAKASRKLANAFSDIAPHIAVGDGILAAEASPGSCRKEGGLVLAEDEVGAVVSLLIDAVEKAVAPAPASSHELAQSFAPSAKVEPYSPCPRPLTFGRHLRRACAILPGLERTLAASTIQCAWWCRSRHCWKGATALGRALKDPSTRALLRALLRHRHTEANAKAARRAMAAAARKGRAAARRKLNFVEMAQQARKNAAALMIQSNWRKRQGVLVYMRHLNETLRAAAEKAEELAQQAVAQANAVANMAAAAAAEAAAAASLAVEAAVVRSAVRAEEQARRARMHRASNVLRADAAAEQAAFDTTEAKRRRGGFVSKLFCSVKPALSSMPMAEALPLRPHAAVVTASVDCAGGGDGGSGNWQVSVTVKALAGVMQEVVMVQVAPPDKKRYPARICGADHQGMLDVVFDDGHRATAWERDIIRSQLAVKKASFELDGGGGFWGGTGLIVPRAPHTVEAAGEARVAGAKPLAVATDISSAGMDAQNVDIRENTSAEEAADTSAAATITALVSDPEDIAARNLQAIFRGKRGRRRFRGTRKLALIEAAVDFDADFEPAGGSLCAAPSKAAQKAVHDCADEDESKSGAGASASAPASASHNTASSALNGLRAMPKTGELVWFTRPIFGFAPPQHDVVRAGVSNVVPVQVRLLAALTNCADNSMMAGL